MEQTCGRVFLLWCMVKLDRRDQDVFLNWSCSALETWLFWIYDPNPWKDSPAASFSPGDSDRADRTP